MSDRPPPCPAPPASGPRAGAFLLFVYGTLKRGGCRHGPLADQAFRGPARTAARYALYDLGDYPGMTECGAGGQVVHGELYEVSDHLRPLLDELEGSPDWFSLGPVDLDGVGGPVVTYYYRGEPAGRPRIESGVWENR